MKWIEYLLRKALFLLFIMFQSLGLSQDFYYDEEKTPQQYLQEAVKRIKSNYIQEKYTSTAFLRQYKTFNGDFTTLAEVQGTVLFNIQSNKKANMNNQAIYIRQVRQTNPERIPNYQSFAFRHPFMKDPVTHQQGNILDPKVFRYAKLEFEPEYNTDYVVIRYSFDQFTPRLFTGNKDGLGTRSEFGTETGTIKIDRKTYGVLTIESTALKTKEYNPVDRRYYVSDKSPYAEDYQEATLYIEYGEHMGKYYLRKLYLKQEVHLYKVGTYVNLGNYELMKEYHFSVPAQTINFQPTDDFVVRPYISRLPCNYDPYKWKVQLPPYFFANQRDVYFSLERHQSLEEQFSCEEVKIQKD